MEGTKEMGKLLKRKKDSSVILTIVMLMTGIIMIMPFVFMISGSLKPQAMITSDPLKIIPDFLYLENYKNVFVFENYFRWYFNSFWIILVILLLRIIFVTTAAYAFARLHIPGKNILFVIVFSLWMIPADTTLVSRYLFYQKLNLVGSPWAVIFNFTFDVFLLFMMRQFFMQVPQELTEAAVVDGASHVRIYSQIMLPLCKPALITMALFTYVWTWNSFMEPYVFIDKLQNQMITVGLHFFSSQRGLDLGMILAGATLATLPTIVLFSFAQRYFVEGIASSGIKG